MSTLSLSRRLFCSIVAPRPATHNMSAVTHTSHPTGAVATELNVYMKGASHPAKPATTLASVPRLGRRRLPKLSSYDSNPSSEFPVRGQPDNDRDYRHPRVRSERPSKRGTNQSPHNGVSVVANEPNPAAEWDFLPPVLEIIEAIDAFTRHCFQLSFISRNSFVSRLRHDYRSVSPFLLLSILSVSAGMTPPLVERFGSGTAAAEIFMTHTTELSVKRVYEQPSLETCQAFYLLGVAQQRSGWKNSSYVSGLLLCLNERYSY